MRAREEEKNTQESDDEFWARLDTRIEWARARHELARLDHCISNWRASEASETLSGLYN